MVARIQEYLHHAESHQDIYSSHRGQISSVPRASNTNRISNCTIVPLRQMTRVEGAKSISKSTSFGFNLIGRFASWRSTHVSFHRRQRGRWNALRKPSGGSQGLARFPSSGAASRKRDTIDMIIWGPYFPPL